MPSYLLDKNVARRIIEALYHLNDLSDEELLVLEIWHQLQTVDANLFVPVGAINILQHYKHLLEVRTFLATVQPLHTGRYLKRWAGRLRQHRFTREDALILALGTYGTDNEGRILGAYGLITLDKPFIRNFQSQQKILETRLKAMTSQLQSPYRHATLPQVLHSKEIVV